MIISAVLAVVVSALCVSGAQERAARAAATPAAAPQATPTPAPTPDYTNVDDILEGRA